VIIVGIDDTDTLETPGTNQLAKSIVRAIAHEWRCHRIVRHQLFFDPRVPYTSKNGSASITLESRGQAESAKLAQLCEHMMQEWFVEGSDPGLCVVETVPQDISAFGRKCQSEIVTQGMARDLAAAHGVLLKGLGGTEGGVIGALAAVGLAVTGDDGRVVQHGEWPDDLSGFVSLDSLHQREIDVVDMDRSTPVTAGFVDVGKHLRPNRRNGRTVLFVRQDQSTGEPAYRAVKLT
jgi:hypothetical protein